MPDLEAESVRRDWLMQRIVELSHIPYRSESQENEIKELFAELNKPVTH